MLHPEGARGEARVVAKVRPSDRAAQSLEELVVVRADVEVAVRRAHGLIRRGEPMRGAEWPGGLTRHPVLGGLPCGERHRGLEERGVDELPESRALAVFERAQNPVGGEEPGAEVGQRHAGLGRRVLVPGHADDPAHALGDQVIAAARRVRPRAAEPAHRAIDEPRVHRGERLVPEAQPLGHARPVILDEDVRGLREALDDLDTFGRLEVDREPALAPVHRHESRAVAVLRDRRQLARGLARDGRLDLDDVGAHVGEVHRAERRRHRLREVDDAETLERFHVAPRGQPLGLPR